ncbi:MAG: Nramp family divalent metal transporter [Chloroflexi bacterium]|nr:Nramp family divalent metal transporter [Chloroflexota bacterium]
MAVLLAVVGPGIITASADNDAGGITTYAVAGAQFGYKMLWILLLTTFALGITQEMGARMGMVTGKGLAALIRERFGIRWTTVAMFALLVANFGSTAADVAGIGAALEIFGVPKYISVPLGALLIYLLVLKGNFRWTERIFLFSAVLYVAYVVSALLAHPLWGQALHDTVVPSFQFSDAFVIGVIATIGTTITPWGQFFIQSYCVDKRLQAEDLNYERVDVYFGAFLTDFISFFIIVATAATLYVHHQSINDASDAAKALAPLAGRFAAGLFALGLLNAALLGSTTLPLSTAYAVCEAFGWEMGLDFGFRRAPIFYGLYTAVLLTCALFVLIPGLALVQVMFITQAINGVLLPVILVFVLLIINDRSVMGKHTNGPIFNAVTWVTMATLIALSLALVPITIVQQLQG